MKSLSRLAKTENLKYTMMKSLFKDLSTQDYITLGYLYLVLLGVINIVIYYSLNSHFQCI
jgi:hypothetical protein